MERVNLERERHAERQRWRNGGEWDQATTCVAVGTLAAGGWYARWYGRGPLRPGACAYRSKDAKHLALATARRWMRTVGGTWVEA